MRMTELAAHDRTPCEQWTRVMGYHRPVSAFNPGKQAEFRERRLFREPSAGDGRWHVEPAAEGVCPAEPYPGFQALGDHPSVPGAPA
jgi:hypothetical protein